MKHRRTHARLTGITRNESSGVLPWLVLLGLFWLYSLMTSCSASETKGALHGLGVPGAAAGGASLGAALAGPGGAALGAVLGAGAGEVLIPTGKVEAQEEAVRAAIRALAREEAKAEVGPLGESLRLVQATAERGTSLAEQVDGFVHASWKLGLLIAAVVVAFNLWHYWRGSRKSQALEKKLNGGT